MSHAINIYEAKTHFSRLVDRVEQGEEIVIARHGRPVAKLVPLSVERRPRKLGQFRGDLWFAPDFDELTEEERAAFAGEAP